MALIHFFLNKLGESHTIQRSNCNFLYEPTHTRLTQDTEKGLDFSQLPGTERDRIQNKFFNLEIFVLQITNSGLLRTDLGLPVSRAEVACAGA